MATTNRTKLFYWVFTMLFILPMAASGIGFVAGLPPAVEGMSHLGYPLDLVRFLGAAKLLGAAAILAGILPRAKEWAYAGFVFNLVGAFYSHLCSGDGPKAIGPLVILSLLILSYFYWRKSFFTATNSRSTGSLTPRVAGAAS